MADSEKKLFQSKKETRKIRGTDTFKNHKPFLTKEEFKAAGNKDRVKPKEVPVVETPAQPTQTEDKPKRSKLNIFGK